MKPQSMSKGLEAFARPDMAFQKWESPSFRAGGMSRHPDSTESNTRSGTGRDGSHLP